MHDLPDNHDIRHLQRALSYCKKFNQAIDCGAHRGIWTKHLCDKFKSVIAIEPSERYEKIDSRAKVINAAIGQEIGTTGLKEGTINTGQTHCVPGDQVEVITLDSLNAYPDFIKIDVEGWELFVLKGGETTIKRFRPVIILEENGLCDRYGIKNGEAGRLLARWGYAMVERCNKDYIYKWGYL